MRIDERCPNDGQSALPRIADAALFVHQEKRGVDCFGDNNRFALAQVQPVVTPKRLNACRVRRFGY